MSARATSDAPGGRSHFLGHELSPLTQRRLRNFRANKRGYWSLWIFLTLFIVTLFAEFVANGAKVSYAPIEKPYGVKECAVFDADGYQLAFGQGLD